jgi:hypothetical protein
MRAQGGPLTTTSTTSPQPYHAVHFYENEISLTRLTADFLAEGFQAGSPGVVVATAQQTAALLREMVGRSLDVGKLMRSRALHLHDADETLATFMVNGQPDDVRFRYSMGQLIDGMARGGINRLVRLFGQMIDVLWRRGQREAAIRLEVLWNELARAKRVVCAYTLGPFYKHVHG